MGIKVLVVVSDGFEEIETITPIDVLRRAGCEVVVAGLAKKVLTGSHGIVLTVDALLKDVTSLPEAIVIPGGPGAEELGRSPIVREWIRRMKDAKKTVGAICAAPATVLAPAGVLEGVRATCFPGYENRLAAGGAVLSEGRVVVDGIFITSRGAGTAMEFSLELVRRLAGPAAADAVAEQILAKK